MKAKKSMITTLLLIAILSTTVVFAATPDFYQSIKNRLLAIGDAYSKKESALAENGQDAQEQLIKYVQGIENEIKNELDNYEQQQIEQARQELQQEVNKVKAQIDEEKQQIVDGAKEKIKEKIRKDLEKEFNDLEKALKK